MPRIRTVKPEFWEDETIATLSRDARLLFVATFNLADDEGLVRWTPSYIKANVFMYDEDIEVADARRLMDELVVAELLFPYTAGKAKQQLGFIVNFRRHQKINRPQPSKLPPPSIQNGDVCRTYERRDRGVCHLCGEAVSRDHDKSKLWPSLDHIKPRSKGGDDYPSNLKLSHASCNKARRDRDIEAFAVPAGVAHLTDEINSLNGSVNHSVNGTPVVVAPVVPSSPPEGNGRGMDTDRDSTTSGAVTPRSDTAQTIVGEWIERCRKRPPASTIGQIAKHIRQMLEEAIDPDDIRRGTALWSSKGLSPSSLPSCVNEVMNSAPSRASPTSATAKASAWMTIGKDNPPLKAIGGAT